MGKVSGSKTADPRETSNQPRQGLACVVLWLAADDMLLVKLSNDKGFARTGMANVNYQKKSQHKLC